jgi:succinate dehydrogenase / fumarate reductase cytochrome b subunit
MSPLASCASGAKWDGTKQGWDGITMNQRPLSPHLQVWRWGPHMLVSILHRATGDGMALVGLGVLVWWLGALASGPEAYASFQAVMGSPLGMLVLVGLSWAFFTHMMSGMRHFVMDIGAGYELDTNKFWSIASPVIAIVLTAGFWALMLLA